MVNRYRIIFITLLLCGLWHGAAAALNVEAVVGQDRIAMGESLQLQLRLDGSPDDDPDFTRLEENWEVLSRSQSSQMKVVNSNFSRSTVYNLTLMPRSEGQLMIPAVCFGTDCSLPITIEVSSNPSLDDPGNEPVQLQTEVSSHQVMALGQLILKVRLLVKYGLPLGQLSDPQVEGVDALVNKLGADLHKHERRDDGQVYQVVERTYVIFPQESGQLLIPGLQYDGVVPGGRTRFDPFARQGMQIRRTSEPVQVEVLPLPDDLGQRPWIPAIAVSLQDDWQRQPPELVVGEPATRTLRLSAEGVLSAQLPELEPTAPDEFKLYFDQPLREDRRHSNGTTGVLEQQVTLVPTEAGRYRLPAVDLDWWDVNAGVWRTAHLDALELDVAPAVTASVPSEPPDSPAQELPTETTVSDDNEKAPLTASTEQKGVISPGFWPWLSLGLALGWLLTLALMFRNRGGREKLVPVKDRDTLQDEKNARRTAINAARNSDPHKARQSLVFWSRTLWPDSPGSYEKLFNAVGEDFRKELGFLDVCLYGENSAPWDGRQLAAYITEWHQPERTERDKTLPELYPG
ncbi:MAG TPA: BatD family protein [Geopsychrobacteraceae bacterium]|nr:BatD family protein [Geopsychrobacteraceae bacterium]